MRTSKIYGPLTRLKLIVNPSEKSKKASTSEVLTEVLKHKKIPHWTSFFVLYESVINDHFGLSSFNWQVNEANYQILRTGCYPYIKYHCSKKSFQDLTLENHLMKTIKVLNLGLPTLAYGTAARFLIKHREIINTTKGKVTIHYLIKEEDNAQY